MPRAFSQNRVAVVGALRLAMVFAVLVLMPPVCLNACLVVFRQVEPAVAVRDATHDTLQEFMASNCLDCHSTGQPEAGFDLWERNQSPAESRRSQIDFGSRFAFGI